MGPMGAMALESAVRALGIGAGGEVFVPALTFVSAAFPVAAAVPVPVFADIDPHTRTIDPAAAAAALTPHTDGVPRTVCLPLASELTEAEAGRVIEAVHAFHTDRT